MSFEEKVKNLQIEVEELDKRLTHCGTYTNYIFASGVSTPFVLFFLLYMINPKFVRDADGDTNRKKLVKYSGIITIFIWMILYGVDYYLKKKS